MEGARVPPLPLASLYRPSLLRKSCNDTSREYTPSAVVLGIAVAHTTQQLLVATLTGMPAEVEIPAPVRQTTRLLRAMHETSSA